MLYYVIQSTEINNISLTIQKEVLLKLQQLLNEQLKIVSAIKLKYLL